MSNLIRLAVVQTENEKHLCTCPFKIEEGDMVVVKEYGNLTTGHVRAIATMLRGSDEADLINIMNNGKTIHPILGTVKLFPKEDLEWLNDGGAECLSN